MIGTIQREILTALIELYETDKTAIKGEDIADVIHRTPGTIRNQMQTLRALGYVDGVPGPRGGYIPAMKAYEALELEIIKKPSKVPVYRDGKKIEGIMIHKINFTKVADPHDCRAVICVSGDTRKIGDHDIIKIGPTPINHLVIRGEVVGRDDTRRELLIYTHSITSIPKGLVEDIATKNPVSVSRDDSIRKCGKMLMENKINAMPVMDDGELVGIITQKDIVRTVAEDSITSCAGDIAVKDVITIGKDAKILSCIEKMMKHDVGRLVVTDKKKVFGIITRTDILLRMLD